MALSLVGYVSGSAASSATVNVTLPGGSAAGDLCVGAGVWDAGSSSTPSGFTVIDGPTSNDSQSLLSFSKVLDATDISNNFVTMPGDPNFNGSRYALWIWHSTNGSPTVDGHSSRQASDLAGPPTVVDSGTITTTGTNDGVCVLLASRLGAPTAWSSTPGGVTTDQDAPGGYQHVFAYHYTFAGPGTTSAQSANIDAGSARECAAVIGVADAAAAAVIVVAPQPIPFDFFAAQFGFDVWLMQPVPLTETVGPPVNANAEVASGTGSALDATVSESAKAGLAAGGQGGSPTFVGWAPGFYASSTPQNVTLPTGSAAADLLVGTIISLVGDTSTPSGFTLIDGPTANDADEIRSFYKVLDGTDISNGYVAMPGNAGFHETRIALWAWRGGSLTIDGHSARAVYDGTDPTVVDSGTITTALSGDGICVTLAINDAAVATAWSSTPGGVTVDGISAFADRWQCQYAYHYFQGSAGATSNQTASIDAPFNREVAAVIGVSGGGSGLNATVATSTNATATLASGTGAANTPTVKESIPGALASGTGTAPAPTAKELVNATLAAGTGAASNATAKESPNAANAAGTGTAYNATAITGVFATAGLASGTGTANNAATLEMVNAGLATGTGTANNAAVSTSIAAGVAAGTGAAANTTTKESPNAGLASGTGTAVDATVTTSAFTNAAAANASGTGTANTATTTESANATLAAGTGSASNATVVTGVFATAGNAAGTGNANTPTTLELSPAALASGTGTSLAPTVKESVPAAIAAGTGTASQAAANTTSQTNANAAPALGTGTAYNAAGGVGAVGHRVGFLLLQSAPSSLIGSAAAANAAGTGSASDATVVRTFNAGLASGAGTASDAFATGPTGGYPTTSNTGVLGATLTTINIPGNLWRTSTDGAGLFTTQVIGGNTYHVFTNKHFTTTVGAVYVDDPYVRFDHCQFDISGEVFNTSAMMQATGLSALILDDCSFNGGFGGDNRGVQVGQGHLTVNRCQFLNYSNAACEKSGDATTDMIVNDSYFAQAKGWLSTAHADAIQTDGPVRDITIHHNTIWEEPYRATDGDSSAGNASTSCINLTCTLGTVRNIVVDNNQMAGAGYCIYVAIQGSGSFIGTISIHDNRFDRTHFASLGGHACIWTPNGVVYPSGIPAALNASTWTANTWEDGSSLSFAQAIS